MFKPIRDRLLLYYLLVLGIVLLSFATTVRIAFARSLNQELIERLETLALTAALELEIDDESGVLEAEDDEVLIRDNQTIQWFDQAGALIAEQGELSIQLGLILPPEDGSIQQQQNSPEPLMSITIPVHDSETRQFLGYARVSESQRDLHLTLSRLDRGLAGGVALALGLSAAGGLWVTRKAMQPIEQSFQRLQRFTSDASHELRSPLMAIGTNAAVALKYPEGMRLRDGEKFRAIQSAASQMKTMTEDLLQLARFDQQLAAQHEALDLAELLGSLVELYQPQANAKGLHFHSDLKTDAFILGNPGQVNRLFSNLLSNAIRYTPEGGAIAVRLDADQKHYHVQIEDTGIGIEPEHQKKVFERFWQVDTARRYGASGSGLGLSLVQEIAQAHQAHVDLVSALGQGSCFTVSFPHTARQELSE